MAIAVGGGEEAAVRAEDDRAYSLAVRIVKDTA
jgi:hypothetical protein